MRLLIADSDPMLAEIYELFFSTEGYEVDIVRDGLECVERTRQRMPDVLVLEYELPWGGGDGVLAHLREECTSVGVVLITCDYSEDELGEQLVPPVLGCLRKPFRLSELSDLVRTVVQHPPAVAPSRLLRDLTVHNKRTVQH